MNNQLQLKREPEPSSPLTVLRDRLTGLGVDATVHFAGEPISKSTRTVVITDAGGATLCARAPLGCDVQVFRQTLSQLREEQSLFVQHEVIVRDMGDRLMQSYEEANALFRVIRFMTTTDDPLAQMQLLCNIVQQAMPFQWIALVFHDNALVTPHLRGRTILGGDAAVAEVLAAPMSTMLDACKLESWAKVLEPATDELSRAVGCEILRDTISHDGVVVGILLAGGKICENGEIGSPEILFLNALADFIGTYHENAMRFSEQRAMSNGTLQALCAAIDAKDPYTRGHSERVALLSMAIALELGMTAESAERIRISGLVHDVGKIGVPEAVLCKPAALTNEEFAMIRKHPEIGRTILEGIPLLEDVLPGVMHHHERYDGKGYPHGLVGDAIPLSARIIGLADAFDAMSSSRSYRAAKPRDTVLAELQRCANTQFEPSILAAFMRVDLTPYDKLLARHAPPADCSGTPK